MSQEEKKRRKRKKNATVEYAREVFAKPKPVAMKIKIDNDRGICCADCKRPVADCAC